MSGLVRALALLLEILQTVGFAWQYLHNQDLMLILVYGGSGTSLTDLEALRYLFVGCLPISCEGATEEL